MSSFSGIFVRRPSRATTTNTSPSYFSSSSHTKFMVLHPHTCRKRYPKLPFAGCLTPNSTFFLASSASQSVLLWKWTPVHVWGQIFRLAHTCKRFASRHYGCLVLGECYGSTLLGCLKRGAGTWKASELTWAFRRRKR